MVEETQTTTETTQETAATDQGVTAPQPTVETSGFTQDEVDKLISQRVARERSKLEKKICRY